MNTAADLYLAAQVDYLLIVHEDGLPIGLLKAHIPYRRLQTGAVELMLANWKPALRNKTRMPDLGQVHYEWITLKSFALQAGPVLLWHLMVEPADEEKLRKHPMFR